MPSPNQRKANNGLGVCLLSAAAMMETFFADQKYPNPASPYVWSVLGLIAAVSLVYYFRLRDGS